MADAQTPTSEQLLADGHAAWFDGMPHKALACFSEAVALLPEDAAPELAVRAKGDLALCLRETGDVAAALSLYPELERLCSAGGLDVTRILRQWAIALEVARDFAAARQLLDRIRPTDRSARMDRLYWHHAVGLLNWSEGRLGEARAHLAAATAALPRKRQEAARVLAVLGNDALLSLYLGDTMRAHRLAQRMRDIRGAVNRMPVASESNLVIVQAALARARGDFAQEAEILRRGLDLIERNDPEEWLHKLDLASRFADAATRAGSPGSAIPWLQTLCDTAPFDMAWVGLTTLARLQVEAGDAETATRSIQKLLAGMAGAGGVEVEAELLATLADLAHLRGRRDAVIVLGKMSLRYLAELIHRFDHDTLVTVLAANDRHVARIGGHLRGAGRFQEAVLLEDLVSRIRHHALVRRDAASRALAFQPLPFDRLETRLEADWAVWRQELLALRDAGCRDDLMRRAGEVLEALLGFETTTGLAHRTPLLPPPPRSGCVQVSLLPKGKACELQYQWSDRMDRVHLGVSPADLFDRVAALREALGDPQAWREPAAELYRWIIGPIEAELDGMECLLVEASGLLGRVPMAVLHDGRVCLGQRVPISYVLNLEGRAHDPASGRGMLCASAFRTGPLARPMGPVHDSSAREHPVRCAIGPEFTRETFAGLLRTGPAYLSVATHFEARLDRPDLSTLLLGDGTELYLSDLATDDFDLSGVRVALFAACRSGVDDATQARNGSLAALALEKGARVVLGTLWDIPETVAAGFIARFWAALAADPSGDPVKVLARLHADSAAEALRRPRAMGHVGGIGGSAVGDTPEDWAAFVIFETCNAPQPVMQDSGAGADRLGEVE